MSPANCLSVGYGVLLLLGLVTFLFYRKKIRSTIHVSPELDDLVESEPIFTSGGGENYDVFICHRGPDVKKKFAGYLMDGLRRVGVKPFLDCKDLKEGDMFDKSIKQAIKSATIGVVIFSEHFAESKWCLEELRMMLEQPDMTIFPIFFNVEPKDVRYPEKYRLARGFKKRSKSQYNDAIILQKWRICLTRASYIHGWTYSDTDNQSEVDFTNKIVSEICKRIDMNLSNLPLHVAEYPVGLDVHVNNITKILQSNGKKVKLIGLWGMGGIGKTTLAKEIFNRFSNSFQRACVIDNVKGKLQQFGGDVQLQRELLEQCGKPNVTINSVDHGKDMLKKHLQKLKMLIVLDDIDDTKLLKLLLFPNSLGEGSFVIITSRDERIFKEFDISHIYEVKELCVKDAEILFMSHVTFGGEYTIPNEFEDMGKKIAKACRVPLTLEICGAHLKNETDIHIWEEVLERLESRSFVSLDDKLFVCLRMTYDSLIQEHKEMFLDVACAFIRMTKERAMKVWEAEKFSANLGLRTLMSKSLVKLDYAQRLVMHSHLQDMGREIVIKSKNQGQQTRLWMPDSLIQMKNNTVPSGVRTLVVSDNDSGFSRRLDLSNLKNLRVLIHDETFPVDVPPPNVLFVKWENSKRTFIWSEDDHGKKLTAVERLSNLVILDLRGTQVSYFPNQDMSMDLNLRELDLSCTQLKELRPSISSFQRLEVLILSNSKLKSLPEELGCLQALVKLFLNGTLLEELPSSIGRLKKLRLLQLSNCKCLKSMAESLTDLAMLEVLLANNCPCLNGLPDSFGDLLALQKLDLSGQPFEELPQSIFQLKQLKFLLLQRCKKLHSLHESVAWLTNLEILDLVECEVLTGLPEALGKLKQLQQLLLRRCTSLEVLPNSLGDLVALQKLSLKCCKSLKNLPESLGKLSNLTQLNLRQCSGIKEVTESLGQLKKLKMLSFNGCSSLQVLPESLGNIDGLVNLEFDECQELKSLPASIGQLTDLQELSCRFCSRLESLPEALGDLIQISKLDLSGCSMLSCLPNSIGQLTRLQKLSLGGCSTLEHLPPLSNLEFLSSLEIDECCRLTILSNLPGSLIEMQELSLRRCSALVALPDCLEVFGGLKELILHRCLSLATLPRSIGQLKNLRSLNLQKCLKLQSLPDTFGDLQGLLKLILKKCCRLTRLPESFGKLTQLQKLDVWGCSSLECLPESFGQLTRLDDLSLAGFLNLKFLPESLGDASGLLKLYLECPNLQMLPDSIGRLSNLQRLKLDNCSKLERLPDSIGDLKGLRKLQLKCCSSLTTLPDSVCDLEGLEELNITGCLKLALPNAFHERVEKLRIRILVST